MRLFFFKFQNDDQNHFGNFSRSHASSTPRASFFREHSERGFVRGGRPRDQRNRRYFKNLNNSRSSSELEGAVGGIKKLEPLYTRRTKAFTRVPSMRNEVRETENPTKSQTQPHA